MISFTKTLQTTFDHFLFNKLPVYDARQTITHICIEPVEKGKNSWRLVLFNSTRTEREAGMISPKSLQKGREKRESHPWDISFWLT